MRKPLDIFLIVCCATFFSLNTRAQLNSNTSTVVHASSLPVLNLSLSGTSSTRDQYQAANHSNWKLATLSEKPMLAVNAITVDNAVKHLSFFCRQEWKMEKTLKLPLRFRVGSLAQCNVLEGK